MYDITACRVEEPHLEHSLEQGAGIVGHDHAARPGGVDGRREVDLHVRVAVVTVDKEDVARPLQAFADALCECGTLSPRVTLMQDHSTGEALAHLREAWFGPFE